MIRDYMAIIYLGDANENISPLTKDRTLASVPVGGSYRIIDFSLSNVVNAGIRNVGLFCGNEGLNSLTDHIGMGAEWDLARKKDGIFIFKQMLDPTFASNQSRIRKNMEYFFRSSQTGIVVLNAHMLCNLDVADLIEKHEASGREITMVYKKVKNANEHFNHCSSVKIDENDRVIGIGQNLFFKEEENISLDAFVISKELMLKLLINSIQEGKYGTLPEIIARNLATLNINAYEFKGYLQFINSTREYFEFNMNLLEPEVRDDGCIIEGKVKNSILSRGTVIEKNVVLEDCVVMQDCHIKEGARLKNVIIDKNNIIEKDQMLSASKEYPLVIEKNISWARIENEELMKDIKT